MKPPAAFRVGLLVALLAAGAAATPTAGQTHEDEERLREEEREYLERQRREAQRRQRPPEEERRELAEAFIAEADQLIRNRDYQVERSAHFEVKTDDPRLDAEAIVGLLESFRGFFDGFWGERATLEAYEGRGRVYLFYSFHDYNQLLTGRKEFTSFRPTGHYRPLIDVIVIYTDQVSPAELPYVLVHEAAHQLVEQRIFAGRGPPSLWLGEGLASYFGHTLRDRSGGFREGAIGGKGVSVVGGGVKQRARTGADLLKTFRRSLKEADDFSVSDVVAIRDPAVFYGEGSAGSYTASWLLVHFLFHGDQGAHAEAFAAYLEDEIDGKGGAETLLSRIGLSADRLDARFRDHVLDLDARR
jgi:hypothetical protein